jgi:alginate O-acetyltransferase complex protein AlgI
MWLLAATVFAVCKCLTWRRVAHLEIPWRVRTAYFFAWPGMDAEAFLGLPGSAPCRAPSQRECLFALSKTLLGAALFWGWARHVSGDHPLVRGWIGLAGLVLMLHFGIFHILSCFWRRRGRNARPLMNWPVLATSVADFWGRRWNTAFRDLTYRFLFEPLSKRWGPRAATLAGFGVSGLIHDLVISIPAGWGYGLPTLYFLVQGIALLGERSRLGRMLMLRGGLIGWSFALLVVLAPAVLLFHPPFVSHVVLPFMQASGALSGAS